MPVSGHSVGDRCTETPLFSKSCKCRRGERGAFNKDGGC